MTELDTVRPGETVYRINGYVEAGTACRFCLRSYWTCTDIVLLPPRHPRAANGCCEQCDDGSGHETRILGQIDGLLAETVARADAAEQKLALVLETLAWDRPYDTRINAARDIIHGTEATR